MIVVRAFPDRPPPGRAHIIDDWPRVAVDDYDYRNLAEVGDNVISLDWDTAVSPEQIFTFAMQASIEPELPLVAPVMLYCDGPNAMPFPCWNLKRYNPGYTTMRLVETGERSCHLFGFGMMYLPQALIRQFLDGPGQRYPMTDTGFSGWYSNFGERETQIAWDVRPVHLHYITPPGGKIL